MTTTGVSAADIIATSAAVIALLAMGATFWQAAIARKHNKLSVRPLLTRSQYRNFGPEGTSYRIGVVNVGVGPALITDRYFEENGTRLSFPTGEHPVQSVLRAALASKIEYKVLRYGLPAVQGGIAPQTELTVFELLFPTLTERTAPILDEFAKRYALVVEYESLYGEKRTLRVVAE